MHNLIVYSRNLLHWELCQNLHIQLTYWLELIWLIDVQIVINNSTYNNYIWLRYAYFQLNILILSILSFFKCLRYRFLSRNIQIGNSSISHKINKTNVLRRVTSVTAYNYIIYNMLYEEQTF